MKIVNDQSTTLAIAARVLCYPDQELMDELKEFHTEIEQYLAEAEKRHLLKQALEALLDHGLMELQELYVATFDYKDQTSLYLTAHELGDSRKRGAALIELQNMITEKGYQRKQGELSDYIPMLLELIAIENEYISSHHLNRRLACAVQRIKEQLGEQHPYRKMLDALMIIAFESPTKEELAQFEKEREHPDLDPLPYPLLYQ